MRVCREARRPRVVSVRGLDEPDGRDLVELRLVRALHADRVRVDARRRERVACERGARARRGAADRGDVRGLGGAIGGRDKDRARVDDDALRRQTEGVELRDQDVLVERAPGREQEMLEEDLLTFFVSPAITQGHEQPK